MNNPVRYRGETFYQSQYSQVDLGDGRVGEMTGLQVVENAGWLIPYVACVLALWGMLAHFGGTFVRFADRHERERVSATTSRHRPRPAGRRGGAARRNLGVRPRGARVSGTGSCRRPRWGSSRWLRGAPRHRAAAAAGCLRLAGGRRTARDARGPRQAARHRRPQHAAAARQPHEREDAGRRAEPARRAPCPATRGCSALMAGSEWVDRAPVFRIDASRCSICSTCTRRQGHRYTMAELEPGRTRLRRQIEALRELPPEQRTFVQKKYAEIEQKLMAHDLVRFAYDTPAMPKPSGARGGGPPRARRAGPAAGAGARMIERTILRRRSRRWSRLRPTPSRRSPRRPLAGPLPGGDHGPGRPRARRP